MPLALDKPKLDNLAGDIWKSAERLRGKFKAYEYQNVILPIIVIRRLECVLIKWREEKAATLLARRPELKEKEKALAKLVKGLETSTAPFSNKTDWTLRKVYEEDHSILLDNFRAYINGFSKNVEEIIDHFNYRATIGQMAKNNRLAPILNQYKELALGPDNLTPLEMGYIYEELLRRFSEQSGEEAGEHFTPREVIRLMVELLDIPIPDRHISIYDPACGTGGMLSVAKEHLLDRAATPEEKAAVEKYVTGALPLLLKRCLATFRRFLCQTTCRKISSIVSGLMKCFFHSGPRNSTTEGLLVDSGTSLPRVSPE